MKPYSQTWVQTHLWSSTQSERPILDDLGKPEICYPEIPIPIQQQVFRFQVPVDNVPFVQVIDRQDDGSDVEPRHIGRESTCSSKVTEEFSSGYV